MDAIREATKGGYAVGSTPFQAQIEGVVGRRVTRGKAGRPVRQDVAPAAGQQDLF